MWKEYGDNPITAITPSADFPPRRGAFHPRLGVVLGFAPDSKTKFVANQIRVMCFHFNKQYSTNEAESWCSRLANIKKTALFEYYNTVKITITFSREQKATPIINNKNPHYS